MVWFLWTMVVLGLGELISTAYHGMKGSVPERTASSMTWNAVGMAGLGIWALWLAVRL